MGITTAVWNSCSCYIWTLPKYAYVEASIVLMISFIAYSTQAVSVISFQII